MTEYAWVKFIEGCDVYGSRCKIGEILQICKDKAEELKLLDRVIILKKGEWSEDNLKQMLLDYIRKNNFLDAWNLLEDCSSILAEVGADTKTGKYTIWIESLHKTPIADGRHRTIDLIFVPYCKNRLGLSEEETVNWIMSWVEECNKLIPICVNSSYIRYKYRRCKNEAT